MKVFNRNKEPKIPREDAFVPTQEVIEEDFEEQEEPVEELTEEEQTEENIELRSNRYKEPVEVPEEKVSFESILLNHDQRLAQIEAALLRIRGSI